MPDITQNDIENIVRVLERDEVPVTAFGIEEPDPLVIEGKMDYVLEAIKGIPQGPQGPKGDTGDTGPQGPQGPKGQDGTGAGNTTIYVNGVESERQDITDDIQSQFDYVEGDVARIDGDLTTVKNSVSGNIDGIAHLNEIKQDKLAQVDLDNIASIDQMKRDINAKASKTEVNRLSMCPSNSYTDPLIPKPNQQLTTYTFNTNGFVTVEFVFDIDCFVAIEIGSFFMRKHFLKNKISSWLIPICKNNTMKLNLYNNAFNNIKEYRIRFIHTKEV